MKELQIATFWIEKLMKHYGSTMTITKTASGHFSATINFYSHPELKFQQFFGDKEKSIFAAIESLDRAVQEDAADEMVKNGGA